MLLFVPILDETFNVGSSKKGVVYRCVTADGRFRFFSCGPPVRHWLHLGAWDYHVNQLLGEYADSAEFGPKSGTVFPKFHLFATPVFRPPFHRKEAKK